MIPVYPYVVLDSGVRVRWRDIPYAPGEYVEYKVGGQDTMYWPGFTFEWLAQQYLSDRRLAWVLIDSNPTLPPDAPLEDITIKLPVVSPLDFVQTITSGR